MRFGPAILVVLFAAILSALGQAPSPVQTFTPFEIIHGSPMPLPALFQAVLLDQKDRVASLLQRGADPNEVTASGWRPLHEAMYKDAVICSLLLAHGADPNAPVAEPKISGAHPSNRWTPIFFAVYRDRLDLVRELLAHGARIDIHDLWGKTPLDYAREKQNAPLVALLSKQRQ